MKLTSIILAAALLGALVTSSGCTFWRRVDNTSPIGVSLTDTVRVWDRGGYRELYQVQSTADSLVGRRVSDSMRVALRRSDVDSIKVGRDQGASGIVLGFMGGFLALLIVGLTQMRG